MEQLNIFSRLSIYIVLLFHLTACTPTDAIDKTIDNSNISVVTAMDMKNSDVSYSIFFANTSDITDLSWSDELSFNIVQVQDMPNESTHLQDTINESIKTAMISWIKGKVINADSVDLKITCHSNRYLSFVNSFMYESKRIDSINDYITIDMLTGQRIYLRDLVEINEEFTKFLKENTDKMIAPSNPFWQGIDLSAYSSLELLEELNKCSYTQEYLIQNGYYSINDSIGSLLFRNSFFLREGMIVITLEQGGSSFITFDVDDLGSFLKVDKW